MQAVSKCDVTRFTKLGGFIMTNALAPRKKISVFSWLLALITAVLFIGPLASAGTAVHAASTASATKQALTTKERVAFETEFTSDLGYIMDQAVVLDADGNVQNLDFGVLYAKYGHTPELMQLQNQVNKETMQTRFKRADMRQCAIIAIQDTLGVSAVNGLISGGIVGLLKKKALNEIAKLVAKYAFKGLVPGVAAASLVWSFGRCMWF